MKAIRAQIADRVRGAAAEHRMPQQTIANVLGVSRASIVERYAARVAFTGPELYTLAMAMDVPVTRFFPDIGALTETRSPETTGAGA